MPARPSNRFRAGRCRCASLQGSDGSRQQIAGCQALDFPGTHRPRTARHAGQRALGRRRSSRQARTTTAAARAARRDSGRHGRRHAGPDPLVDLVGGTPGGVAEPVHGPAGGVALTHVPGPGMIDKPLGQAGQQHEIAVGDAGPACRLSMSTRGEGATSNGDVVRRQSGRAGITPTGSTFPVRRYRPCSPGRRGRPRIDRPRGRPYDGRPGGPRTGSPPSPPPRSIRPTVRRLPRSPRLSGPGPHRDRPSPPAWRTNRSICAGR